MTRGLLIAAACIATLSACGPRQDSSTGAEKDAYSAAYSCTLHAEEVAAGRVSQGLTTIDDAGVEVANNADNCMHDAGYACKDSECQKGSVSIDMIKVAADVSEATNGGN